MKKNTLADEMTGVALRQLMTSYTFKLPRIIQIRKFRDLYNNKVQRQLRIRYNAPIPIFAGMIDTLQADLDDGIILKATENDPADYKSAKKFDAYLKEEMESMRPGAMWNDKFRSLRQEVIMTGRGFLKYSPNETGGDLSVPAFESMFFEPKGGGNLERHLFAGETDIWMTQADLESDAGGIYDAGQVKMLQNGSEYKPANIWDNYDFANRFLSMGLTAESTNYVGEKMFNMVEWVLTHKGQRWYLLFEARSGIWVRFEKLTDVHSSGYLPWMSCASHKDIKNFASKSFADDLYPHAMAMTDLFNEDLENKRRRNSNARGYDKDMFPDVAALDLAQTGRDRLVEMDTKGGTRRIDQGIYQFTTPEITGTLDTLKYMEDLAGRNFGVNDMQKGDQGAQKTVGVTYAEMSQVSKRLAFTSQPFIEVGQQLGMRVFGGLKDYMKQPMAIKLLGENGFEWDNIKRVDLNTKEDLKIDVSSQSKENRMNELAKQNRLNALEAVRSQVNPPNPNINSKMADEYILRDVGGYTEAEIALLLDPQSHADKRTIAETSAAIQMMMRGKMPKINYDATAYFLQHILDFVKTHQDDKMIQKNFKMFMQYIQQHQQIAIDNEKRRAQQDAQAMMGGKQTPNTVGSGGAPASPIAPAAPTVGLPTSTGAAAGAVANAGQPQ